MAETIEPRAAGEAETLAGAVRRAAAAFRTAGLDTPELDARILVCEATGLPRSALLSSPERELSFGETERIDAFARRRLQREPVSRIVGRREFHGLSFELGPTTLDPRPDTETLIEAALELKRAGVVPGGDGPRILDLGTGSGAILVALLAELTSASGVGIDKDAGTLEVARRNASLAGVAARATFCQGDWFGGATGPFDLVVSNPPYIPTADISRLQPEVSRYDPVLALDGGADGLTAYRQIVAGSPSVLRPGGWLLLEVGMDQAGPVLALCQSNGLEHWSGRPGGWTDLNGVVRCVAVKAR